MFLLFPSKVLVYKLKFDFIDESLRSPYPFFTVAALFEPHFFEKVETVGIESVDEAVYLFKHQCVEAIFYH